MKLLFQLVIVFFKVGAFTIGGGYAMVPAIKTYIVDKYHWLTDEEFLDIIAITQSMPGPIAVNAAFFIGYRLKKSAGGILASLAAVMPAFLIMIVVAVGFREVKDNIYVIAAFKGIRPTVVALVLLATISLGKTAKISKKNFIIPLIVAAIIIMFGISPLWVIVISFIAGSIYWSREGGKD